MTLIERAWYQNSLWLWLLSPFSLLFWLISATRRQAYRFGLMKPQRVAKPVLVVGNITVGGSGKTPLVIWLCETLSAQGIKVGVISRGYGGRAPHYPYTLTAETSAAECGDEPLLIYRRTGAPVVVAPDRVAAARQLLAEHQVDMIISDDGLQHYRLARDLEIIVIDGRRRFGNTRLLPQGPLREGLWRLSSTDLLVCNSGAGNPGEFEMQLRPDAPRALSSHQAIEDQVLLRHPVAAAAGIGDPERFFNTLRDLGLSLSATHALPDHYAFPEGSLRDLRGDAEALLITEKDAVKGSASDAESVYYLPISASLPESFRQRLLNKLEKLVNHGR